MRKTLLSVIVVVALAVIPQVAAAATGDNVAISVNWTGMGCTAFLGPAGNMWDGLSYTTGACEATGPVTSQPLDIISTGWSTPKHVTELSISGIYDHISVYDVGAGGWFALYSGTLRSTQTYPPYGHTYPVNRTISGVRIRRIVTLSSGVSAGVQVNELYLTEGTDPNGPTPPAAPSGVTVTNGTQPGTVLIGWSPVASATGYQINRNGSQLGITSDTEYLDSAPVTGTTNTYTVYAVGEGGTSDSSSAQSITLPQPPGVPTGLTATAHVGGEVGLAWSAPSTGGTATGYWVYRDAVKVAETTETTYTDTATQASTTYTYTVRAYNSAGLSTQTDPAIATTATPTLPPASPGSLTAAPGAEQVVLSWPASTGATGYRIYRDGVEIGTTASLTYTATDLVSGVSYEFAVAAFNAVGESPIVTAAATPTEFVPSGNLWRFDFLAGLSASVSQTLVSLAPLFWIVGGLIVATGMVTIGISWLRRGF